MDADRKQALLGVLRADLPETVRAMNAPAVTEEIELGRGHVAQDDELPPQQVYDADGVLLRELADEGLVKCVEIWGEQTFVPVAAISEGPTRGEAMMAAETGERMFTFTTSSTSPIYRVRCHLCGWTSASDLPGEFSHADDHDCLPRLEGPTTDDREDTHGDQA